MAFKVKTTAPKLYSVRPNAYIIPPNETSKVAIVLQGFSEPLSKHYKCKDKFLIVSLPCPEDADPTKVSEFWPELEKSQKANSISKKLKVNYIIGKTDDDKINEESEEHKTKSSSTNTSNIVGSNSAAVASQAINDAKKSPTTEEIQENKELADSYNQINKLNEKFDQAEKSKSESSDSTTTDVKKDDGFSGISLPLTIILMILAFIIGWLIF